MQYWNGTDYVPATSEAECRVSGFCDDAPMDTWWNGACVFESETFHRRPCQRRYRNPCVTNDVNCTLSPDDAGCFGCVADNVGCVVYPASYNQTYCESTVLAAASSASGANPGSFRGVWHAKARTEAQCAAHGCGCLKSGAGQGLLRSYFISTTRSNASYCAQFDSECVPYYNWSPARWLGGTWRGTPQWQPSAVASSYRWTNSSADWTKIAHYVVTLVDGLYAKLATTQAQCRLNRIAPALEAVSCSCSADAQSQCLKTVVVGTPIGIMSPCAGISVGT